MLLQTGCINIRNVERRKKNNFVCKFNDMLLRQLSGFFKLLIVTSADILM